MPLILRISTIVLVVFLLLLILNFIRKNKLSMKYALLWLVLLLIMFVSMIVPHLLEIISTFFQFEVTSNMIFAVSILILILVCLSLTIIVSKQYNMIRLLVQEVSLLKSKQNGDF